MGEKFKQGVCDLRIGFDDPRTRWDEEGCESFNPKHKQTIDKDMPQYCLRACGNCEYFTVAEYEYAYRHLGSGEIERSG